MLNRSVWKSLILIAAALTIVFNLTIIASGVKRVVNRDFTGIVLVDDPDVNKQHPIANVSVETEDGATTQTDASGLFHLKLPISFVSDVRLSFAHAGYVPLEESFKNDGQLYVIRMKSPKAADSVAAPELRISDVRIRYTERDRTSIDTGSAQKSFEVINKGGVACGHEPCSPDGKWQAAIGGASLDAGEGNTFREARVSCISGPCPFTRIEHDGFSQGGRVISVNVRNWSDTVSFVMEAEVSHMGTTDRIRLSYPLIFGRAMNFSLPPSGEGPSIVATVAGSETVYPLGPGLLLSWANCAVQTGEDSTRSYRCDLKPGYRFQ